MKRTWIRFILLVLVAAVINLITALCFWVYYIKHELSFASVEIRTQDVVDWRDRRRPGWSLDPDFAYMSEYFGIITRALSWKDEEWFGSPGEVNFKILKLDTNIIFINEFGWPLQCIADERWLEVREPGGSYISSEDFIVFGAHAPNRVLWSGMIINVLYYCLAIVLIFLCWSYVRRGLRRMNNRCIKCGYDLRGATSGNSVGCPECGYGRDEPIISPAKSIEKV